MNCLNKLDNHTLNMIYLTQEDTKMSDNPKLLIIKFVLSIFLMGIGGAIGFVGALIDYINKKTEEMENGQ